MENSDLNTFERVSIWNALSGKNPPENSENTEVSDYRRDVLLNQIARIDEELQEAYDAVIAGDDLEALDAGCDLDVTVAGFAYLLGVKDYQGAINAVLDNNDKKLYLADEIVEASLYKAELEKATGDEYFVHCTIDDNDLDLVDDLSVDDLTNLNAIYTIHRKSDDKIIKKADHPKVKLEEFL